MVAKQELSCVGVVNEQAFDSFAQQAFAEGRVESGQACTVSLKARVKSVAKQTTLWRLALEHRQEIFQRTEGVRIELPNTTLRGLS